jgi:hypothetical protein
LNPALPALPPSALRPEGDPLPAAGHAEGRPAFAQRLESCLPAPLALTPLATAGDDLLRFVEWRIDVGRGDDAFSFGVAERVDLAAGNTLAYFDTLALATRLAASSAQDGRAA